MKLIAGSRIGSYEILAPLGAGGMGASCTSTGHLIYGRAGVLLAAPFDPRRLEVTGPPFATADGASCARLALPIHADA